MSDRGQSSLLSFGFQKALTGRGRGRGQCRPQGTKLRSPTAAEVSSPLAIPRPRYRTSCKYLIAGYCKNGINCEYTHTSITKTSTTPKIIPSPTRASLSLMLASDGNRVYGESVSTWGTITELLSCDIGTPKMLCQIIKNCSQGTEWDLSILFNFLSDLPDETSSVFFEKVLPWMKQISIDINDYFPSDAKPSLLRQCSTQSVELNEFQLVVLMSHCFFCIMPHRHHKNHKKSKLDITTNQDQAYLDALGNQFGNLNFLPIYQPDKNNANASQKIEKLKCLLHFFIKAHLRLVEEKQQPDKIQVVRVHNTKIPDWRNANFPLCELEIEDQKAIEESSDSIQVDFANKVLGGGVIGRGCVQEEIRFLITPGLFLARMISESLTANETVRITGCRQYSTYTGYGDTFKWGGDYSLPVKVVDGYPAVTIAAMDATNFKGYRMDPVKQYTGTYQCREVTKCYVSLLGAPGLEVWSPDSVATGRWGCGVFGGDIQFKTLLQICAASAASKRIIFHTYSDPDLGKSLQSVHACLTASGVTVAGLYRAMSSYSPTQTSSAFDHVMYILSDTGNVIAQ